MNTCAFLLILTVQIYADGIEGPTGKARIHLELLDSALKFPSVNETPMEAKPGRVWRILLTLFPAASFSPSDATLRLIRSLPLLPLCTGLRCISLGGN